MGKYTAIKSSNNPEKNLEIEEMIGQGIPRHQQVLKDKPAEI